MVKNYPTASKNAILTKSQLSASENRESLSQYMYSGNLRVEVSARWNLFTVNEY